MKSSVTKWLIFSVVLSLLPIICAYFHKATLEKTGDAWPSLTGMLIHGELLLISVALAADALGDLLESGPRQGGLRIWAGGGCLVCVVSACFYFAAISSDDTEKLNSQMVFGVSLVIFFLTLLSTGICKIIVRR